MGTIKKSPLSLINGRIGNLVIRDFNGKKIVSMRPEYYKKSKSPAAMETKNRFSSVVALAKTVNEIPLLYSIWDQHSCKGNNPYMKILNSNLRLTNGMYLGGLNHITPPKGFINPVKSIQQLNNKFILELNFSDYHLKLLNNSYYLILIIFISKIKQNSKIEVTPHYLIFPGIELQNIIEVPSYKLPGLTKQSDSKIILYTAFIQMNPKKKTNYYSNTTAFNL